MKVVSRYCDSCGVKIPATDIQDAVALKYEDSYYCKECKADILPLIDKKGGKGGGNGAAGGLRKVAAQAGEAAERNAKPGAAARRPAGVVGEGSEKGRRAAGVVGEGSEKARRAGTGMAAGSSAARAAIKSGARKPVKARDEEEDDGGGSEEELDAEDAPKKNKLLIPLAAAGVAVVAIGLWLALSSGGGSGAGNGGAPGPEEGPKKSTAQLSKEKSEKVWAAALSGAKDKPMGERIKALRAVTQDGGIADQGVMDRAESEIEALEADYKAKGKEVFEELNAKARQLAEVADYEEAIATLRGFPGDLRETPWYTNNVKAEISKYEENLAAKAEAEPLMRKAREYAEQKEFRLAAGVLEGFDAEQFRKSPWVAEFDKLKRNYEEAATAAEQDEALDDLAKKKKAEEDARLAEIAAKRRKEDERIASMNWERLPTDDLFTWKLPPPTPGEAWKTDPKTKELTGKSGGSTLPNMTGTPLAAVAGVGNKAWIDFIFEFRYKIVKGNFQVGVRASEKGWVSCEPETIADGQWHSVQMSVRGMEADAIQQVVDGVPKPVKIDNINDSTQGGIAFGLLTNSEVVFADIRIKVISKAN